MALKILFQAVKKQHSPLFLLPLTHLLSLTFLLLLRMKTDTKLHDLKMEVSTQDSKHWKTLAEVVFFLYTLFIVDT